MTQDQAAVARDAAEAAASGLRSETRDHSPEITLERAAGAAPPGPDEVPATEEVPIAPRFE